MGTTLSWALAIQHAPGRETSGARRRYRWPATARSVLAPSYSSTPPAALRPLMPCGPSEKGRSTGRLLLDVSNALDHSGGFPPTLFVSNTDSLAEQLQRAFPRTMVVKAFNTMTAAVMVNPKAVGGGDTTVFVAGNDPDARATVAGVATDLGWTDVMDLGDLTAARGLEMWLPLWLRLLSAVGVPMFNIKVVR